jgi:hypothetical protein
LRRHPQRVGARPLVCQWKWPDCSALGRAHRASIWTPGVRDRHTSAERRCLWTRGICLDRSTARLSWGSSADNQSLRQHALCRTQSVARPGSVNGDRTRAAIGHSEVCTELEPGRRIELLTYALRGGLDPRLEGPRRHLDAPDQALSKWPAAHPGSWRAHLWDEYGMGGLVCERNGGLHPAVVVTEAAWLSATTGDMSGRSRGLTGLPIPGNPAPPFRLGCPNNAIASVEASPTD